MSGWPRGIHQCKNCACEASINAHGGRGYCGRCYYIMRYIEDVQRWDRGRRETLKRLPKNGMFRPETGYRQSKSLITDNFSDEQFERCRKEHIRQLTRRLTIYRNREEIRQLAMPVSALDLEGKFAEVMHLVRRRAAYPQHANYLSEHFDETQRRVLYSLLEEIIEQAPWDGISWSQVGDKVYPLEPVNISPN